VRQSLKDCCNSRCSFQWLQLRAFSFFWQGVQKHLDVLFVLSFDFSQNSASRQVGDYDYIQRARVETEFVGTDSLHLVKGDFTVEELQPRLINVLTRALLTPKKSAANPVVPNRSMSRTLGAKNRTKRYVSVIKGRVGHQKRYTLRKQERASIFRVRWNLYKTTCASGSGSSHPGQPHCGHKD